MSVGASSTRNQMVEAEAKDTNLCTTYSIENTSDVQTKSVKIQEKLEEYILIVFDVS